MLVPLWQVVCKPGTVTPHKRFEGEIYALNKEEGGTQSPTPCASAACLLHRTLAVHALFYPACCQLSLQLCQDP